MNDRLKEALNKIPFKILGAMYIAYAVYGYYDFLHGTTSEYVAKKAQIESLNNENNQIREKAKKAEEFYRTLDLKRAKLRAMSQDLQEIKATLSEDMDIAALIRTIVTEAKKVGMTVTSIKPDEPKAQEFYIEQPFQVQFTGVYGQLVNFLDHLSSVERIVRVDNYDIKNSGDASLSAFPQLSGTVQIKAFRYLGTKADDIARTGGSDLAGQPPGQQPSPGGAAPAQPAAPVPAPAAPAAPAPGAPGSGGAS